MTAFHKHDSNTSIYLGSKSYSEENIDFYFAPGAIPTVIARFGEDENYFSGLLFVKALIDVNKDTIEQLKTLQNEDSDGSLLCRATLMSIEQGHLDTSLKPIQKNKLKIK